MSNNRDLLKLIDKIAETRLDRETSVAALDAFARVNVSDERLTKADLENAWPNWTGGKS